MDLDFDHPVLLIQLLIFHEGYHHGQIMLTDRSRTSRRKLTEAALAA
jgi:hypothetical protein